jgi:hypothetical protein
MFWSRIAHLMMHRARSLTRDFILIGAFAATVRPVGDSSYQTKSIATRTDGSLAHRPQGAARAGRRVNFVIARGGGQRYWP